MNEVNREHLQTEYTSLLFKKHAMTKKNLTENHTKKVKDISHQKVSRSYTYRTMSRETEAPQGFGPLPLGHGTPFEDAAHP